MTLTQLTETQERIVINALYTAADRYRQCAKEIAESNLSMVGKERLIATFKKQADECSELLEVLE